MNFITGVGQKLGEGGRGRGTHSHWPVYAIRLTVDPFSASFFLYWMPLFFTTSYTQWPPIVAFSVKIFQRNQKCVKLPGFCAISCQITPFFGFVTYWVKWPTPFLQENCHWWSLNLMHQYEHPCHFRMLVLPQERERLCSQTTWKFEVWSYGPDLKSSLRVLTFSMSKHTYLLVPSGNFPLNNRANLNLEVKIPDWCYNLYPQFNCEIAPKRLQLFTLLKYMFWPLLSNNYVIYI